MDNTILIELEEAMRTKNESWLRELSQMIIDIADDIERDGQ